MTQCHGQLGWDIEMGEKRKKNILGALLRCGSFYCHNLGTLREGSMQIDKKFILTNNLCPIRKDFYLNESGLFQDDPTPIYWTQGYSKYGNNVNHVLWLLQSSDISETSIGNNPIKYFPPLLKKDPDHKMYLRIEKSKKYPNIASLLTSSLTLGRLRKCSHHYSNHTMREAHLHECGFLKSNVRLSIIFPSVRQPACPPLSAKKSG